MGLTTLITVFALFWVGANGCGMLIHNYVTMQSLESFEFVTIAKEYIEAGSYFPDCKWHTPHTSPRMVLTHTGGYPSIIGCPEEAEKSHWIDFQKAFIAHIVETVPRNSTRYNELVSFLLGTVSHGIADLHWHGLGVSQGFLDAVAARNFRNNHKDAHDHIDPVGDFALHFYGGEGAKFLDSRQWRVPVRDLVAVYAKLGMKVTEMSIQKGMLLGFLGFQFMRVLGKYVFYLFGQKSPFMNQNLFTYPVGGIDSMSFEVSRCWDSVRASLLAGDAGRLDCRQAEDGPSQSP